jgi:hypothetical protein
MILALIIGSVLVNLGALLHFYALKAGAQAINPDRHPVRCFMFSIQIIIVSHLLIAAIFAGSFHAAEIWWHLGTLASANNLADPLTFMDRFYFSLVNGVVAGTPGRLILGAFCSFQDAVNAAQVQRRSA